ncbi:ABC transporter permease [Sutcliffiella sp. NPDC057660]|uniref:ABC transporter permease n=1 Tax=Sutcliffiella sp. NPDC057660 TaxID=3346199 RepID=UPI003685BEEE
MNFMKRAFLSVKTRAGKSLLLLFTLTVICVFVLSGLSIQTAAGKSAELARQNIGGNVTLQVDREKMMEQQAAEGGRPRFEMTPISLSEAEELIDYPEVKGYNFTSSTFGKALDFEPIESGSATENDSTESNQGGPGRMGGMMLADLSIEGVLFSDSVQAFLDGDSTILKGRHLTEEDADEPFTLIEKTLAEENDLSIGDKIQIQSPDEVATLEFEIIGIYETTVAGDSTGINFTALNPYNKLYVPYTAATTLKGEGYEGTIDSAVYYMNDPSNIEDFIGRAEEESSIDFATFKLDANDLVYQQMVGPIENVASFSKNVVYLVAIAGAVILGLIVMLTIRERKYEMGVLLAIGEKRWKLMGQFIVEILIVAIISLSFASMAGNLVANQVGEQLLHQQLEQSAESASNPESFRRPGMGMMGGGMGPGFVQEQVDPIDELEIAITSKDFGLLAIIGLIVSIVATIIPSLTILRLQPKMILTKQD